MKNNTHIETIDGRIITIEETIWDGCTKNCEDHKGYFILSSNSTGKDLIGIYIEKIHIFIISMN